MNAAMKKKQSAYTAKDIEVLEGLEPVRRRPGMYIGGTDDNARHHLVNEVFDNSMDEAVAGHADRIKLIMREDGGITISDNGRGIPVDPHPKFKKQSALEVIMTMLHSGGKFSNKSYETSGGLHGVGVSVVNALSEKLIVRVSRDKVLWEQEYSKGHAVTKLKKIGPTKEHGTEISFWADPEIFGEGKTGFNPAKLYRFARSKAYLFKGVWIDWECAPALVKGTDIPAKDSFHFPEGLLDYMKESLGDRETYTPQIFAEEVTFPGKAGRLAFAIAWPRDEEGFFNSYCNTIPTPEGGTHENGLRSALSRSLKDYGDRIGNKKASEITTDDVVNGACIMLSLFLPQPQFQGQTKDKLASPEATRLVENAVKDRFDLWLTSDTTSASILLDRAVERVIERQQAKQAKELKRQSATRKLRLPGKLVDCAKQSSAGTEIFLVEGDSAGGSAKQARSRDTQAVLPLRGKIMNVASASAEKLSQNQELKDLVLALGCGTGKECDPEALRYERIIIMTDADVDGAHIAALLLTFFYREMMPVLQKGHVYLAVPPLYRLSQGDKFVYARDDKHKEELMKKEFTGRGKVEISRFKGLGEMPARYLKDTTMDPEKRTLLRVMVPDKYKSESHKEAKQIENLVERLMGRKPELRLAFIQEHAPEAVKDLDV
ncbi:MAG: DNA topoisomerase IV subunit B [Dongiaceae bacterium]